jgi:hypothetical protein
VGPVAPGRTIRVEGDGGPPVKRDARLPRFRITITSADPDSDGVPIMSGEVTEWEWTIDELDGDDLVEACRRYLRAFGAWTNEIARSRGSDVPGPDRLDSYGV